MKNQEDSLERKTQVVKKSYKAMVIAKYIVNKCTREGQSVSNLQLQKILFFAQGEFYKNYGRPLFQDDI